jgi:hypothetical protein
VLRPAFGAEVFSFFLFFLSGFVERGSVALLGMGQNADQVRDDADDVQDC